MTNEKNIKTHARRAMASRDEPLPLVRTVEEAAKILGAMEYEENLSPQLEKLVHMNCHIGQRKLSIALIEFLTVCRTVLAGEKRGDTKLLVVYPGSSLVAAISAARLFPGTRFLCFDPNFNQTVTNARREVSSDLVDRYVHVSSDKETALANLIRWGKTEKEIGLLVGNKHGFYGDESHLLVRDLVKQLGWGDREVVFTSDIRLNEDIVSPKEESIAQDMCTQALWTKSIGARFFMHKMRLPFELNDKVRETYDRFLERFESDPLPKTRTSSTIRYLAGQRYIQLYGRKRTTETRLIGTSGVHLCDYDIETNETVLNAFNIFYRSSAFFKSKEMGPEDMAVARELLLPQGSSALSTKGLTYDVLAEALILKRANKVASETPGQTPTGLRELIEGFSLLFRGDGRQPATCRRFVSSKKRGGDIENRLFTGMVSAVAVAITFATSLVSVN